MAAGHPASRDAEDFAGDDRIAVQQDDPVHGADELRRALPPAHAARDRQAVEGRLHDAWQKLGRRLAGAGRAAEEELALRVFDAREFMEADAAGLGEGRCRARRLAGRVESGGYRRAPALDALLRLPVEELRNADREPARRKKRLCGAVREARGLEAGDEPVPERLAEGGEALRRHFLGADLDQEIVAVHRDRFFMRTVDSELLPEGTVPFSAEPEKVTVPAFARRSGNPCASRLAK